MPQINHELIAEIEDFLTSKPDVSESAFGRMAANDGSLIADLRQGREVRAAMRRKIKFFIAKQTSSPKDRVSQ